jgi:hypothetical protein
VFRKSSSIATDFSFRGDRGSPRCGSKYRGAVAVLVTKLRVFGFPEGVIRGDREFPPSVVDYGMWFASGLGVLNKWKISSAAGSPQKKFRSIN